ELDHLISGLQPGDLIVVSGRPSVGKTSFTMNIAENVARESNKNVIIFSMEMGATQLGMRMLCAAGRLNLHNVRSSRLEDEDWGEMVKALGWLNGLQIDIIDSLAVGWNAECIDKALLEREIKPSLVVVDGLHSFDVTNTATAYDRNIQLGEHVRILKKMALKLNVPVILTTSLSRELEYRPNKRPVLKDLRDIGLLEDVADLILFIYREELHGHKGSAEIIIGKQRNGPTGMVELIFNEECMRFENPCQEP
ncbi:MAG: replicative DNA helicase, partial [Candidatus Moranbacteria bacterium CG_4_8_14_3_um_filter_41_13]